jgi:hypothetical protein
VAKATTASPDTMSCLMGGHLLDEMAMNESLDGSPIDLAKQHVNPERKALQRLVAALVSCLTPARRLAGAKHRNTWTSPAKAPILEWSLCYPVRQIQAPIGAAGPGADDEAIRALDALPVQIGRGWPTRKRPFTAVGSWPNTVPASTCGRCSTCACGPQAA